MSLIPLMLQSLQHTSEHLEHARLYLPIMVLVGPLSRDSASLWVPAVGHASMIIWVAYAKLFAG